MSYVLGLKCKECGHRVAGVAGSCLRAVFRPVRGRIRLRRDEGQGHPRVDRRAGPRACGGTRTCCRSISRSPGFHSGFTPLKRADRLAKELGCTRAVHQGRLVQLPDLLLQGARRLGRDQQGDRVRVRHRRLRQHGQPRQLHRRPRGAGGHPLLRDDPARPGAGQSARLADLRADDGPHPRQLRRRQPPLHRDRRQVRLGDREREPSARTTPKAPRPTASKSPSSSAGDCRSTRSSPPPAGRSCRRSTRPIRN